MHYLHSKKGRGICPIAGTLSFVSLHAVDFLHFGCVELASPLDVSCQVVLVRCSWIKCVVIHCF